MGNDDDGEVEFFVECVDELPEALLSRDVDADGGFVEDEELWIACDGAGDHDALELTSGERTDGAVDEVGEFDELDCVVDRGVVFSGELLPRLESARADECDGLMDTDGPIPVGFDALGEVSDQSFAAGLGWGVTKDADGACGGFEDAEDEFDERGLSTAVWPQNSELGVLGD